MYDIGCKSAKNYKCYFNHRVGYLDYENNILISINEEDGSQLHLKANHFILTISSELTKQSFCTYFNKKDRVIYGDGIQIVPPLEQIKKNIVSLNSGGEIKVHIRFDTIVYKYFENYPYMVLLNNHWTDFKILNIGHSVFRNKRKNDSIDQKSGFPDHTNILVAMLTPTAYKKTGFETKVQQRLILFCLLTTLFDTFMKHQIYNGQKWKFYDFISRIVEYRITIPILDKNYRISYSTMRKGSNRNDVRKIADVQTANLYRAGEHTSYELPQLASGAINSGFIAANKIIKEYKPEMEMF